MKYNSITSAHELQFLPIYIPVIIRIIRINITVIMDSVQCPESSYTWHLENCI